MSRYKITIQYDGLDFSGFQSQKNLNTIQDKIEYSLSFLNENNLIRLLGASRTDSGVHALGQVAHFDLDTDLSLNAMKRAINARLPVEIRIIDIIEVDDQFHSRFDAIKKEYLYQCCLTDNPLLAKNHFIVKKINFEILKDIEDELFISLGTVKNHLYNIYKKLNIKSRTQLVSIVRSEDKP